MTHDLLKAAFKSELALSRLERDLIRKARSLYERSFSRISKAQMAAVEDAIVHAGSYEEAVRQSTEFLAAQLEKLQAEADRTGEGKSWLQTAEGGDGERSLGETLQECLRNEADRNGEEPKLDSLTSLLEFWGVFRTLHRYRAATGEEMPLSVLELEPESESRGRTHS